MAPCSPSLPRVWEKPQEAGAPEASGLILVGTVHGDPKGHARVRHLLEQLRPEAVSVEISSFSVRYRTRHGPGWQRQLEGALAVLPPEVKEHLAVRRLAATVRLPYEWQAAVAFGRRHRVPVVAVDASAPAREHLPRYARKLLTPENLLALAALPDGPVTAWAAGEYRRARLCAWRPLRWLPGETLAEVQHREEVMARRLRRLARRFRCLVHLGGWEHLAPREPEGNLFDRLADLHPRRWLLEDVEARPARPAL
ncbi:MAG: hypothetical protein WHT07_04585 [Desulfobaccales bacterium]